MSLWSRVRLLDPQSFGEIQSFYSSNNIPIEVRDSSSTWIEDFIHQLLPSEFAKGLSHQIQSSLGVMTDVSQRVTTPFYVISTLSQFQAMLAHMEHDSAHDLHQRFLSCLEMEDFIVNKSSRDGDYVTGQAAAQPAAAAAAMEMNNPFQEKQAPENPDLPSCSSHQPEYKYNGIRTVIDEEMRKILTVTKELDEINTGFYNKRHDLKRHQDQLAIPPSTTGARRSLNGIQRVYENAPELLAKMTELRTEIVQMVNDIYAKIKESRDSVKIVVDKWAILKADLDVDLIQWTQHQKMSANGIATFMKLNNCQQLSEYLLDVVWKLRKCLQISDAIYKANMAIFTNQNINHGDPVGPEIPELLAHVTKLIIQLVQDTFILAHQPTQVVKTNTKFPVHDDRSPTEVRLLVGGKLSIQLITPIVQVVMIDEKTATQIEAHGLSEENFKRKFPSPGKLNPDNKRFPAFSETGYSSVVFKDLQINNFSRDGRENSGKGQAKLVTEEKLCLLFRSEFSVDNINFQVFRKSLPIAVCTHVSQDSSAWAAVTWDNAYSRPSRLGFEVEEYVSWESFKQLLNFKFAAMTGTSLPEDNVNYLTEKVSILDGFPNMLSWTVLCHDDYPGSNFSLWDWFYEGTKIITKHFKDALKLGYARGFVNKEAYESMLCNSGCSPGTFLFRLSDSVCGGMSIMWFHSDGKAYSQAPFTCKDLAAMPLVDKLNQENLLYVFPDVKKEEGLKDIYEQHKKKANKEKKKKDYVPMCTQFVISNPNFPKFIATSKNGSQRQNDTTTAGPQQHSSRNSQSGESPAVHPGEGEKIEIDVDELLNDLMLSPQSTYSYNDYMSSPITPQTPQTPSPYGSMRYDERERQRGSWSSSQENTEETFYMQL